MSNFQYSEYYFENVSEPKIGEVYFLINGSIGVPVIILDGKLFRNERLSNVWTWRNLFTGKKEYGYGGAFYEMKKRNDESIPSK